MSFLEYDRNKGIYRITDAGHIFPKKLINILINGGEIEIEDRPYSLFFNIAIKDTQFIILKSRQ